MIVSPLVFHQICAGTLKTASRSRFRIFLLSLSGGGRAVAIKKLRGLTLFRCVFFTPFFFSSCFPICVICYSLATTRIFSRTTEEQGGTNLRVESFHFCFSVRFLNSFFLLKLFPGMCCLFFLTHHPHFSQTTGEQGRTN